LLYKAKKSHKQTGMGDLCYFYLGRDFNLVYLCALLITPLLINSCGSSSTSDTPTTDQTITLKGATS